MRYSIKTTVKETHKLRLTALSISLMILIGIFTACNSKDPEEEEFAVTSSTVAVKKFNLQANYSVLSNLDSVFFAIDIVHKVIYNADSLPKGTKVSRLIPSISFMTKPSAASLIFKKSDGSDTTVNYLTHPNDSIDFTHPVTLNVVAPDGVSSYSYQIKVNVHTQKPDSMIWDKAASADMPSRFSAPKAQKTVKTSDGFFTFIQEKDETFSMLQAENIENLPAAKPSEISFDFSPVIESMTWSGGNFYVLSESGELYFSADTGDWQAAGEKWISITGPYLDCILGLKYNEEGILTHTHYPAVSGISDSEAEPNFPLRGTSNLGVIKTGWSPYPTVLLVGGEDVSGNLSAATWAFDGSQWTVIGEDSFPAVKDASLIRYTVYRESAAVYGDEDIDAWLLYGGTMENNESNDKLYVSINNGISWIEASTYMQLPDDFPALSGANVFVENSVLNADISDYWNEIATKNPGRWYKVSYQIEGMEITWNCPYIYIVGGYDAEGKLSTNLWKAVLARLAFTPVF